MRYMDLLRSDICTTNIHTHLPTLEQLFCETWLVLYGFFFLGKIFPVGKSWMPAAALGTDWRGWLGPTEKRSSRAWIFQTRLWMWRDSLQKNINWGICTFGMAISPSWTQSVIHHLPDPARGVE